VKITVGLISIDAVALSLFMLWLHHAPTKSAPMSRLQFSSLNADPRSNTCFIASAGTES